MTRSRKSIFIVACLAALALGLAFLGPKLVQERIKKVPSQSIHEARSLAAARGVVESEGEVEIRSETAGTIEKILVERGDVVKKGQPLVSIEHRKTNARLKAAEAMRGEAEARLKELEAGSRTEDIAAAESRLRRAESMYERAHNEHERQKRLYAKGATTFVELESMEERAKVASAELNEAKTILQRLKAGPRKEEIEQARAAVEKASSEVLYHRTLLQDYTNTAPFDGVIVERLSNAGEMVSAGTPLLTLIDPQRLRVRAELEEIDVGKVSGGQEVEVSTDAYKAKVYRGIVTKVLPAVKRKAQKSFDPATSYDINTQEIHIALSEHAGLKHGMSVTVRFKE